ncbi:MAG: hypothetical protein WDM81_04965 [Rhizomicrobium sp.]
MVSRQVQKLSCAAPPLFGEPRHAALERVAVKVCHSRQPDAALRVAALSRCIALKPPRCGPPADPDSDAVAPAIGQQRGIEMQPKLSSVHWTILR